MKESLPHDDFYIENWWCSESNKKKRLDKRRRINNHERKET